MAPSGSQLIFTSFLADAGDNQRLHFNKENFRFSSYFTITCLRLYLRLIEHVRRSYKGLILTHIGFTSKHCVCHLFCRIRKSGIRSQVCRVAITLLRKKNWKFSKFNFVVNFFFVNTANPPLKMLTQIIMTKWKSKQQSGAML